MSYQFDKDDAVGFAHWGGYEFKVFHDEMQFLYCPYCQGGGNRDEYTFSINIESGAFNCLRSSCGMHGHFVELCRDFDYPLDVGRPAIYRVLPQPKKPLTSTPEAIAYMESRGISREITERYEITTHKNNSDVLVFPFFDEAGRLQFVKYRDTKFVKGKSSAKEWAQKDTMPILFGMKQCEDFSQLIITEGQIDSLSVAQAGFKNAVSVPTGAKGFTWYPICKEWIEKFEEVIVFGDYERGHISLLDELKARLPQTVKCVRTQDYLGEKDANDILRKYGVKAIQKCIENAQVPTIENVKDMAGVQAVDINGLDRIPTGFTEIDRTLNGGMYCGQVILVTGKRGEGKSTLVSQIANNALNVGENVFIYSGELADYNVKYWMDMQLAGARNLIPGTNEFGDTIYSIPADVQEKINAWYRGRCWLYDNDYVFKSEANEMECLMETIEKVIKVYGVRLITLDNLMTAMEVVHEKDSLYLAQSNFVGSLKKIAMKYKVVIILVAHPKKGNGEFDNDNVSGSSDITNKVDVVINYSRDVEPERQEYGYIQIAKNRLFGILRMKENCIKVRYSPISKRVYEPNSNRMYGWENVKDEVYVPVTEDDPLPF